jgi:hypothetical protein
MIGNHKKLFTQSDNRVKFRIKGRKRTTIRILLFLLIKSNGWPGIVSLNYNIKPV